MVFKKGENFWKMGREVRFKPNLSQKEIVDANLGSGSCGSEAKYLVGNVLDMSRTCPWDRDMS